MRLAHRNVLENWQAATAVCLLALWMLPTTSAVAVECLGEQFTARAAVTLQLEPSRSDPALVYKTDALELYIFQSDLSDVLSESEHPRYPPSPLSRAIRELPPFTRDVTVDELLDQLGPPPPNHPKTTRSEQWREYLRETRNVKSQLNFGISRLLERGRVAARDPRTGAAVLYVQRTQTSECASRVVYRTMDGAAFLEMDSLSLNREIY